MPKKRHQHYPKPQSTAPASLASSAASHNGIRDGDHERPSVNQLLASLRRTRLGGQSQQPSSSVANITAPSVPPQIREILRLPETPAPRPRQQPRFRPRFDAHGRRLPPGPPPPRSWTSAASRHGPGLDSVGRSVGECQQRRRLLPGLYKPGHGSLVDIILRSIALDFEYQRYYNVYYLSSLPDRIRMALITYVGTHFHAGLCLADLKIILLPPAVEDGGQDDAEQTSPSTLNEGITHLDLSTSIGRSISLRELSNFLFPLQSKDHGPLLDSWDSAEAPAVPRPLLPNLTHLSLATSPENNSMLSWKQLLSISAHLPTLTHLSLAYWPVPSLTPNLKYAKVETASGQAVQAGGLNPYSHTLDDDWSEAILVLRKLSKNLYGLEYLDLTGCVPWLTALTESKDGDQVDWVGDWGKISRIVLATGHEYPPTGDDALEKSSRREMHDAAQRVEKAIRTRRAGRGRFITVETDGALQGR